MPLNAARSRTRHWALVAGLCLAALLAWSCDADAAAPPPTAHPLAKPTAPPAIAITPSIQLQRQPLSELSQPAVDFLATRDPQWGVAIALPAKGLVYETNADEPFAMASVTKIVIMLALLRHAQDAARPLTDDESLDLTAMITESDNDSATALWDELGGPTAVSTFLQEVNVHGIFPASPPRGWGDSSATAAGLAQLLTKLWAGQILDSAGQQQAITLMTNVIDDQRWGVTADFEDPSTVAVKDGWYPAITGWRVASAGIGGPEKAPIIAVVLTRNQQTMEYGIATIEGVAQRVGAAVFGSTAAETPAATSASTDIETYAPPPAAGAAIQGSCSAPSRIAVRPDAWQCTADGATLDPCFATGDNPLELDCPGAGDTPGKAIVLETPLPSATWRTDEAHPWLVTLSDGGVCTHARQPLADDDGDRITYACADGRVLVGPLQRGDEWFALVSTPALDSFSSAALARVAY